MGRQDATLLVGAAVTDPIGIDPSVTSGLWRYSLYWKYQNAFFFFTISGRL